SYENGVKRMVTHKLPAFVVYLIIVAGMIWLFTRIPAAFLPEEDQGVIFAQVQTPAGSSAERTQKVIDDMRDFLLVKENGEGKGVNSVFSVNGFNFAGRGQSSGLAFVTLKPWDERDAETTVFK
ncbi:efflux RND transporter permease subunit, partial [Pseudomonas viridiflava]|uniref:efflux RND transporter permease subunit n=1 Tax=Pseudomonas viridiflava TaxID=33069 RepID=UPI0019D175F8